MQSRGVEDERAEHEITRGDSRIGAKEEGTLRSHMVNDDGSTRDTVYFSVIAPEWPEVSARLLAKLGR